MIDINELRRLAQAATPHVGHACKYQDAHWLREGHVDFENADLFIASERPQEDAAFYAAANPAAINELLDRLEAAESDALEQARLNGMGASREAALMAKLEAAEKERDALQAKVEEMEKQKPVATVRINAINGNPSVDFVPGHRYLHHNDKLYLAPGAQPAPSVPEGWKLVPIEPTPGMMRAALCALVDTRGNSALFRATLNRWIAMIFTPCLSWCQSCLRCDQVS